MMLMATVAVLCGMGISCKKDQPTQPPSQPGHTAITFQVTFTSIRWCRLQWSNDSTAASPRYLLIRDGRDTLYNDSLAAGVETKVLQDTVLKPGTSYSYWVYRIVNGQRWDSATVNVRTLDTTKQHYSFEELRYGNPGSGIYGIWGTSPQSVWMCGLIDSGMNTTNILHVTNDSVRLYYVEHMGNQTWYGCYGTSDSSVYFVALSAIAHYDGHGFVVWTFADSLHLPGAQLLGIWVTPDDKEVFAVGNAGTIVHRKADGSWENMSSGTSLYLMQVRGSSAKDVYAIGQKPDCDGCEGVILHYDGTIWSEMAHGYLPVPADTNLLVGDFADLGGESTDSLYTVGQRIYKRDGVRWELPDAPWNGRTTGGSGGAKMEGVGGTWNNMWVVGDLGFIEHFNGERWNTAYPYFYLTSSLILRRVLAFHDEVFIVGGDNQSSFILHGR
jgi:hypothetical protein